MERTFPEVQRGRQAARGIGYAISRRLGTARFDGGSRLWDSIVWEIPANREKNREFHRFSRFLQTTVPKTSANSAVCKMSSLPDRTGNQFATTGKQFRLIRPEQGKGAKSIRTLKRALIPRRSLVLRHRGFDRFARVVFLLLGAATVCLRDRDHYFGWLPCGPLTRGRGQICRSAAAPRMAAILPTSDMAWVPSTLPKTGKAWPKPGRPLGSARRRPDV